MALPILRRQPLSAYRRVNAQLCSARPLHTTPRRFARDDTYDKDSINVESREYSRSGGDEAAARRTEDTAFSRDKTTPEEQHDSAASESGDKSNPLDVSPANPEISQPTAAEKGGSRGSPSETGSGGSRSPSSGGGSPQKNGGGKYGGSGSGA